MNGLYTANLALMLLLALSSGAQEAVFRVNSIGNTDKRPFDIVKLDGFRGTGLAARAALAAQPEEGAILKVDLDDPTLFKLHNKTTFIVCPADSVAFRFDPVAGQYVIEGGRHPAHLDLPTRTRQLMDVPRQFKNSGMDVSTFKDRLEAAHDRQQRYLDSLDGKDQLRNDVYRFASELARNEYLVRLISPLDSGNVATYWPLLMDQQKQRSILEYFRTAHFPGDASYSIAVESFLRYRAHLLNHPDPRYYVFDQILTGGFGAENQRALIHSIFTSSGNISDIGPANLQNIYQRAAKLGFDSVRWTEIDRSYHRAMLTSVPIPDSVLDGTRLRTTGGDTVSLRRLIDEMMPGGKPLLIDFWASWCGPCIRALPAIRQFALEQADRIKVLYISVDEDADKWKDAYTAQEIGDNQYLATGAFANPLIGYLRLTGVPGYIFLNGDRELTLLDHWQMVHGMIGHVE